jgi:hypothetical protein
VIPVPSGTIADDVAVAEIQKNGMPTGNEHVAIYKRAKPGQVFVATTDMPNMCHLDSSIVDAALKATECILYHNHPSNRSFSISDYIGVIDPYPLIVTVHALGHDLKSNFAFTPTAGARDIGNIANSAWTLTENYSAAMLWLDCQTGTLVDHDDEAARHGIALGLQAAGLGDYTFPTLAQLTNGPQSARMRDVASAFVVAHARMMDFCHQVEACVDHLAISNALAWLTSVNANGVFCMPYSAVGPSQPIAQQIIADPAFFGFFP